MKMYATVSHVIKENVLQNRKLKKTIKLADGQIKYRSVRHM